MATYLILGCACIVSGFVGGGLLALTYSAATVSWNQERMQRKVREAWNQARQLREECEARHGATYDLRNRHGTWQQGTKQGDALAEAFGQLNTVMAESLVLQLRDEVTELCCELNLIDRGSCNCHGSRRGAAGRRAPNAGGGHLIQ